MNNSNFSLTSKYILLVIVITILCSCSDSIIGDFKEITGEEFPNNALIIEKEVSPTDFHGDYGSISIAKVGKDFCKKLPNKLIKKGFVIDSTGPRLGEFEKTKTNLKIDNIIYQFKYDSSSIYYYVGFINDDETIVLIRSSW